jgi:hypothetical protein
MSTTDASETDAILAQFPGPVSIYPDGDKVVGLLAIAALFVILGVFGAFHARQHIWFLDYVMSALCIFYFGWLLVGFTRLVTSGAPLLTLRGDGLSATTGLRKWDLMGRGPRGLCRICWFYQVRLLAIPPCKRFEEVIRALSAARKSSAHEGGRPFASAESVA